MTPAADHGEQSHLGRSHLIGKVAITERAAQPAEITPIYVFLVSTDATYVTGEIYGATGGQTLY